MANEEHRVNNMYSCIHCNKKYDMHTMYSCYHGHYMCNTCYKGNCSTGNIKTSAVICNSTRLQNREYQFADSTTHDTNIMFPKANPHQNQITKNDSSLISVHSSYHSTLGPLCRRPTRCPHQGCNKTVAVCALDSHFKYEHHEVPIVATLTNIKNTFKFQFNDINGNIKTFCLLLIGMEDCKSLGLSAVTLNSIMERTSWSASKLSASFPKAFFHVLVTKIPQYLLEEDNNGGEEDLVDNRTSNTYDHIMFYVTSNVITNLWYTIALSTQDESYRLKYFGPIPQMGEPYQRLFDEGKGLILTRNHVDGMTDFCMKDVRVDVLINTRDDNYDQLNDTNATKSK